MDFSSYQDAACKSAIFPSKHALAYLSLGLMNEAGEAGGKVKKYFRGDYNADALREMISGELGDVLWYLAVLAAEMEIDLGDVAEANIAKLKDRLARGVVQGNGDNR